MSIEFCFLLPAQSGVKTVPKSLSLFKYVHEVVRVRHYSFELPETLRISYSYVAVSMDSYCLYWPRNYIFIGLLLFPFLYFSLPPSLLPCLLSFVVFLARWPVGFVFLFRAINSHLRGCSVPLPDVTISKPLLQIPTLLELSRLDLSSCWLVFELIGPMTLLATVALWFSWVCSLASTEDHDERSFE